jgi:hypothetical protein
MKRAWFALLPLAALAACRAGGGASDTHPNGSAGASGSSGSSGSGSGTSTPVALTLSCAAPQLGEPVLRLLNRDQFTKTINDIFPQLMGAWASTLPADPVSSFGFDNDAATVVGPQLAQAMLDSATSVATAVTGSALATILPCSTSSADRTCAGQFVTQYGRRFFRRSLTQPEQDRYLTFFDTALAKSDFKTALKWVAVGLIQSPNAVYRSEIGAASNGSRQLSPTELATEVAYTYSGSTPSDALLTQAESGTPLDVVALAKSLLATDAGKTTLQHFFESYLDYARVASISRSGIDQFPNVRGDMILETRAFIDQVVVQGNGGLKELLTANTTNPSQALASYYGFPSPATDYASVARASGQGIGVLAQGSILASRAQPNGSSPTQRGLLIFSRLLCNTKPSPPANVPAISQPDPGMVTTRQRYETLHAQSPACKTCHTLFDPIGFGFEHFDEGGRYRATESGLPIDTVSDVPKLDGSALFQFQDQETLAQGLAAQEVVYQCFAAYLATYAFGTGDSCLGASRVSDFKAGTLGIADYYAALAAEPHFTRRASE